MGSLSLSIDDLLAENMFIQPNSTNNIQVGVVVNTAQWVPSMFFLQSRREEVHTCNYR